MIDRTGSGVVGRLDEVLKEIPDRDPKLVRLIDLYLEDADLKPRDAARELEVPVEMIYQMRKRLERRLLDVVPHSRLEGRPHYHEERSRRPQRRED